MWSPDWRVILFPMLTCGTISSSPKNQAYILPEHSSVGRLASGSFLINDPGIKLGLEEPALRHLGGEMEGWTQIEYHTPEGVECIIIKGIADFADGTIYKVWQPAAAKAAVDYAHFKLKQDAQSDANIDNEL